MNSTAPPTSLADYYFEYLKNLNPDAKTADKIIADLRVSRVFNRNNELL